MGRPRGTTNRIRVQLDFVIVLPREVSSLPIGGDGSEIHNVIHGAWKAAVENLREGVLQDGDNIELAPHGKMRVGLDNRSVKARKR